MAKAKKAPVAPVEEAEGDGLIEITTQGTIGDRKDLYINGVATSVPCGIVMRVTPEAAEQLRQCNLL